MTETTTAAPPGARLVKNIWFPEQEHHLADMVENGSKVGEVTLADGRRVGTYQQHKLRHVLKTHLPAERRHMVVDVGGHVGLWSMHLADIFARVEAFEPIPLHCDLFRRNVGPAADWADDAVGGGPARTWVATLPALPPGRGRACTVRLHHAALAASAGEIVLDWNPANTGNTHSVTRADGQVPPLHQAIAVRGLPLDAFALAEVDLVKIDVEGSEVDVIAGAAETLRRCRPVVIVEQKGNDEKFFRQPRNAAAALLESMGGRRLDNLGGDFVYRF